MSTAYKLVTSAEELATYREAWDATLSRSADPQVTCSPDWQLAWWRAFGHEDGRSLRALLFFEKTRLVGVLPLVARRYRHPPGIVLQRLEMMPSGENERDEICSDYIGPIVERGSEIVVAHSFGEALLSGDLGTWDELLMPAMSADCPAWPPLVAELRERGVRVDVTVTTGCPYAALPSRFEDYIAGLSPSRRHLVRRSLATFEKWNGAPPVLERATDAASLARGVSILTRLHGTRWSAEGQAGVFAASRFRAFHDEVMPKLLEQNRLELSWVCSQGEPVAAIYGLIADRRIQIYQSGRAVDVPKDVRPGIVSHALAIRDGIARGIREYDFLAGTARYKMELASATRPLVRLRATHGTPAELARRAAEVAIEAARSVRDAYVSRLSSGYKRTAQS